MTDAYNVTAERLNSYLERVEAQTARIKDETAGRKEIYDEAKGEGLDIKAMKALIKLRAMKPDQRAEDEAVLDTYKSAVGLV
jgi:uncharacterized protein (UPF0335 family)